MKNFAHKEKKIYRFSLSLSLKERGSFFEKILALLFFF